MNKNKRFFSAIMIMLLVFSFLTGCTKNNDDTDSTGDFQNFENSGFNKGDSTPGGTNSTEDSTNTNNNANATGSNSINTPNTKFGVNNTKTMPDFIKNLPAETTINILSSAKLNSTEEALKVEEFKKLTGKSIKFTTKVVDWNSMPNQLATMVFANNAPDMFSIDVSVGAYLVQKSIFEDMDKYIDFNDALWQETKSYPIDKLSYYKGKKYAASSKLTGETNGLLYNKTLTDAAVAKSGGALKDPIAMFYENKWDWDALKKFLELITVKNGTTYTTYGMICSYSNMFSIFATSGIDIIKTQNNVFVTNLDDPKVKRAYTYVQGLSSISNDLVSWDVYPRFAANKVAFIQGHPYYMNDAALLGMKKAGKMEWVPFPKDPSADKYYAHGAGTFSFIPKGAKNAVATAAWYYYDRYLYYNENPNVVTKRKQMFKDEYGWTDADYQYYLKDVNKQLTLMPLLGDRVEGFEYDKFMQGLSVVSNGTPESIIAAVKPSHVAALEKFNLSNK